MGRVADAAPQPFRGSAASQGGAPKVRTKVTQVLPSGHGRFAGLAREGRVFLWRIFGRVFKRLICVRSDFTCRNSLDFALGHRLCGLSGAPPREALPPLRGRDQSRILRRLLRILSPWVQWRWCSRCTWEGPRLRGPDLGPLDPPVDHDSGFLWGNPDYENVPIFYWRSDRTHGKNEPRPDHISGLKWQAEEEPTGPTEPDSLGSYFPPQWELKPPHFPWGPGTSRGPKPRARRGRTPHPWYLSWLVSKNPPGFYWKERGG